jgi:hypothetical protein
VPTEGQAILNDSLTCLRLISCTEQTERVLGPQTRETAYAAWQEARRDIFEEWVFQTDPINLQPKVRPLMKRAAQLVRKFPPLGMDQDAVDAVANSLEAPWGARIEYQVRDAMGEAANAAAALRVVEVVRRLKLQPYQAPEPLPPIEIDEVELVCWMAVFASAQADRR